MQQCMVLSLASVARDAADNRLVWLLAGLQGLSGIDVACSDANVVLELKALKRQHNSCLAACKAFSLQHSL